jgi:hypothetical protein
MEFVMKRRNGETGKRGGAYACFALVLLLCSPVHSASAQGDAERQGLLEQQKFLQGRIERLRQEQDFLLFQKEVCAADSKYLLLNFSEGKGTLKYRNRILRSFYFTSGRSRGSPEAGMYVLTRKIEGPPGKRGLVFGDSFLIRAKRTGGSGPGGDKGMAVLSVGTRDLSAIFFAVEPGTMSYVTR